MCLLSLGNYLISVTCKLIDVRCFCSNIPWISSTISIPSRAFGVGNINRSRVRVLRSYRVFVVSESVVTLPNICIYNIMQDILETAKRSSTTRFGNPTKRSMVLPRNSHCCHLRHRGSHASHIRNDQTDQASNSVIRRSRKSHIVYAWITIRTCFGK